MPREYAKGKTCIYCEQVIEYNGGTGSITGKDFRDWFHTGCEIVDKKWNEDYKLLVESHDELMEMGKKLMAALEFTWVNLQVSSKGNHLKVIEDDQ
ncbi:MAG: hypothetical protein ABWY25_11740 [Paenisporosarcina sp.]